jgi:hypothetical protein
MNERFNGTGYKMSNDKVIWSDNFKKIRNETVVANWNVLSKYLYIGVEENHEKPQQNRSPDRDKDWGPI